MTTTRKARSTKTKVNHFEKVTNKVIELIESGKMTSFSCGWNRQFLANATTMRPYRGILNQLMLHFAGFSSPYWMTFNNAKNIGASVRKGEKGTLISFYNFVEDKNDPTKAFPIFGSHTVFNVEQIDGLPEKFLQKLTVQEIDFQEIASAEEVIENFKDAPIIKHGGTNAAYLPSLDEIRMPHKNTFHSEGIYYSTLFHELTHATGAKSRLNREGIANWQGMGSQSYSKEELIAEMGAAFAVDLLGLNVELDRAAGYLKGYLNHLKADPKFLITAATAATRATKMIFNLKD